MADTSVCVRMDRDLREDAERILTRLGITPDIAMQMFYSQIVLTGGLPFTPKLPVHLYPALTNASEEQITGELKKSFLSLKAGREIIAEEVKDAFAKEYASRFHATFPRE